MYLHVLHTYMLLVSNIIELYLKNDKKYLDNKQIN